MTELAKNDPIVKMLYWVFLHIPSARIIGIAANLAVERMMKIDPAGTAESLSETYAMLDAEKTRMMSKMRKR